MNRDNERQSAIILSVIGIIPVVWLALLIAPSVKGGLPEILPSLLTAFNNPFHIELCEDSLKTVLVLLLCYVMGIGIYFSTQKNYRRREEHGSAKWGNARAVNKKYRQSPASANRQTGYSNGFSPLKSNQAHALRNLSSQEDVPYLAGFPLSGLISHSCFWQHS